MQPSVSILIPVYNHSLYIEECLNAITCLNYSNIEVLICDDGSKDDSYIISENWVKRNSHIKSKLFTQENQGVCKTLNRLIRESSGEYITICASDDVLATDGITQRIERIQEDRSKLACIADAYVIDEHSKVTAQSAMNTLYNASHDLLQTDIVRELVLRWSVVGPTLLIKRSAYNIIGFYDESLLVEDRDFYLRLLARNGLIYVNTTVASYRVHANNSSRKSLAARLIVLRDIAISNVKYINQFGGVEKLFLQTHIVDLLIFNKVVPINSFLGTIFLLTFRVARKLLFRLWL